MSENKPKHKKSKSFPKGIIPIIALVLTICSLAFMIGQIIRFVKVGDHNGENLVGAMTKGFDAGKNDGLSAKDTEQKVKSTVEEMGKLEVLVANVKIPEYHSVGEKYAAMYLFRGSAVFTVDLSKANISVNDSQILVLIPKPTAEIKIDNTETEKIKSRSALFFNGSSEEGLEAYLNTLKAVDQISTDSISNFSELNDLAKGAAKLQLKKIIENIAGSEKEITFSYIEE